MEMLTNFFANPWPFAALALTAMLVEFIAGWLQDDDTHDLGETAASLSIAVINKTLGALTAGVTALPLIWLHQFALFDIPDRTPWTLAAAFVLTDFCYYWHHFAMHKIRLLWASHSVHHSPTRLNLTAAVRLGVGGHLTGGFLFYAPLVLIGFSPLVVYAMLALGLTYQLFLHPARARDLGPLEYVLNTPKHHHVHHASNDSCLDRNFGGVLIVFDRMFGTFAEAPEDEPLAFGLKAVESRSNNPIVVLFREWYGIVRDALASRSPKALFRAVFSMKPPRAQS
jgi:sterol desaturase/sphingolipid hydroxylase (fatty acid hydroxylase superfamily)